MFGPVIVRTASARLVEGLGKGVNGRLAGTTEVQNHRAIGDPDALRAAISGGDPLQRIDHIVVGYATPAAFAAELEQQRAGSNPPVASPATTPVGLWLSLDERRGSRHRVPIRRLRKHEQIHACLEHS